jgi:hypothetical protein
MASLGPLMENRHDQDDPIGFLQAQCGSWALKPGTVLNELHGEIGFWREMLKRCNDTTPLVSVERMQFALELAERKLRGWIHGQAALQH